MKQNIFKNVPLNDSLGLSPCITFKQGDKKKKRKKNSYTDKFIDKKKLTIEYATTEKIKKKKRNITSSKKEPKTFIEKTALNEINKQDNEIINAKKNKFLKNDNKITNEHTLSKNHSYQNFNIKFQFLPKNKTKFISSGETSLNEVKNKSDKSNNLNSNIILINNNNINYTNKNESEKEHINKIKEGQNINIILNNKIHNINKSEEFNIKKEEIDTKKYSEFEKIKNIIIDNNKQILNNEEFIQNEKIKNLVITNISDITNNISNIYSNTEQSVNSNININKFSKTSSNSKINEYCFKKNHNKGNINNNFPNENTYSKERILTNYNNDLEINISDIKKSKIKNDTNENNYFFKTTIGNRIIDESKEIEENTNTIINRNKNHEINEPLREFQYNKKNNLNVLNNEKEINNKLNQNEVEDKILYENNDKNLNKDYKIYEVNTFRMIPKEEKIKNNNNDDNENEKEVENNDVKENVDDKTNNYMNKNKFINSKNWIENEKNTKINFDEYINKAKERLIQIRNKNNLNNNISKVKIKSTLNYILNQNNEILNDEHKIDENKQNENDKNILNNFKGIQNNKYIVKKSNRMQNFLLNIQGINNRRNNFMKNKKSLNNNIPDIKSIVDKNKIEVFDEEEFMQIKKRNLSSNKINILKVNEDLKYLENTIKLQNMNIYNNIGKKIIIDENILPPNIFDYKEIFNKTLLNNIKK